jgi:uncharacterized protein (TIGR03067 family)
MKATLSSFVLMLLALSVHAADKAGAEAGDLGRLQGRWTAMAGPRRDIRVLMEVKGRDVSVAITTRQGLDFQADGEVTLDEKTSPRSVTWSHFVGPGEQPFPDINGIYKVEGDTFTVRNGGLHGPRPKEFKPGDTPLADLVVFRRLKADEGAK